MKHPRPCPCGVDVGCSDTEASLNCLRRSLAQAPRQEYGRGDRIHLGESEKASRRRDMSTSIYKANQKGKKCLVIPVRKMYILSCEE